MVGCFIFIIFVKNNKNNIIMKQIKEVRNHHVDDENNTFIDAYFSDDDNAEGKVIAIVCNDTNKVHVVDNRYRLDKVVKDAIEDVQVRNDLSLSNRLSKLNDLVTHRFNEVVPNVPHKAYSDVIDSSIDDINDVMSELKEVDGLYDLENYWFVDKHGVEYDAYLLTISTEGITVYDNDRDVVKIVAFTDINHLYDKIALVEYLEREI